MSALYKALWSCQAFCLSVQAGCCTMRPQLRQQDGIMFSKMLPIVVIVIDLQVIASLPCGPARRLYTAPHSLLDTFPSQHPTYPPSHPPRQLLQKHPTSSSALPTAVPSTYQVPGQIPYQTAESASTDVQELSSRSSNPILPAETAAASEAAAAADSAPSRSAQPLHGVRSSHQGPASVSASSQGADDKSLRGSTGQSASNAVMGATSASAAESGLAYANSSLPAFRLPPPVESPSEVFGANLVWAQAAHPQVASWHESSGLTATADDVGQVSQNSFALLCQHLLFFTACNTV